MKRNPNSRLAVQSRWHSRIFVVRKGDARNVLVAATLAFEIPKSPFSTHRTVTACILSIKPHRAARCSKTSRALTSSTDDARHAGAFERIPDDIVVGRALKLGVSGSPVVGDVTLVLDLHSSLLRAPHLASVCGIGAQTAVKCAT